MAQGGFVKKFYEDVAPIITGLGASVVIVGALFKIMHWNGASAMLIVGLGTEAVLFAMFAFAPKEAHYHWERVYPQLLDNEYAYEEKASHDGVVSSLGDMLAKSGVNETAVQKLGAGLQNLSNSVAQMSDLSNAAM